MLPDLHNTTPVLLLHFFLSLLIILECSPFLVPRHPIWVAIFSPFLTLDFLPGGLSWDRTAVGREMSSSLWSWVRLNGGPARPEWQNPASCPPAQPSDRHQTRGLPGSSAVHLGLVSLSLCTHSHQTWSVCESVIKTRQTATEVSCLGHRCAAEVKGHFRLQLSFVGR